MEFEFSVDDGDDLWSGMPHSPMEPFQTRRNREWIRAFTIGFVVWCLFVAVYRWTYRPTRQQPESA